MEAIKLKTHEMINARDRVTNTLPSKTTFFCSLAVLDYMNKKVCLFLCKRGKPRKMTCIRV